MKIATPPSARAPFALLAAILIIAGAAIVGAMRQTSMTFDEIVLMAGGARGYETGKFDLVPEQGPIMQYVYGLPIYLARPNFPDEPQFEARPPRGYHYYYGRKFFFEAGNDPERLTFLGRLGAVACALATVAVVYAFTRRAAGETAALLAAALVAFLPDILAHGGVAYNDVPHALAFFAAVWGIDAAVRSPSLPRGALAGALVALAIGVKFSALALGPIAVLLAGAEALARGWERAWLRRLALAGVTGILVGYIALVAIYLGDLTLADLRWGLDFTFRHVREGHGVPGYLLGELSADGWWYFYPVAFLLKTPAAFHALIVLAVAGLLTTARRAGLLESRLRAPVIAGVVFLASLLQSNLVIGFRHALPLVVIVCVLAGAGAARLWQGGRRHVQFVVLALVLWYAGSSLSYYPHFLAYTSEYVPGRDRGHEALLDSSLDWGQGLLQLREYMREAGISRVYLSYFGSALPEGYGIDYVPLPSFFPLPPRTGPDDGGNRPSHIVVSATNLHGVYLPGDPFRQLRQVAPDTILAHTLFVYRIDE